MKKTIICTAILSLMICLCSCSSETNTTDSIYSKIHNSFYDIENYTASCTITSYSVGSENTYDCVVDYNSDSDSFTMVSDDIHFFMNKDKVIITRGSSTIESPALPEDMYIFVNSFFESYYEGEETSVTSVSSDVSESLILETTVINPTEFAQSMKLWVNKKTILPEKMQVLRKDNTVSTEIVFNEFKFNKQ